MMKNDMTDMNVQKANEKSFFGKNMTFKNLISVTFIKRKDVLFTKLMS